MALTMPLKSDIPHARLPRQGELLSSGLGRAFFPGVFWNENKKKIG
jgi:hypothetical protein